jgi:hypothetical protein
MSFSWVTCARTHIVVDVVVAEVCKTWVGFNWRRVSTTQRNATQHTDEVAVRILEKLVNDRVNNVVHFTEEVLVDRHLPPSIVVRVCGASAEQQCGTGEC